MRALRRITTGLIVPLFLLGSLAGASAAAQSATQSPMELIRATTEALLSAVDENSEAIRQDPGQAKAIIDRIVTPHVDLQSIGRWILGKHWRTATPEQRERFVEELRTLLIRTYATALTEFTATKVKYVSERISGNNAIVRTDIPQPSGRPVNVTYRLHRSDERWLLYDVIIEGVSMITTYRHSFGAQIQRQGLDSLLAELADKNRQNEVLDTVLNLPEPQQPQQEQ